jgi:hypothetical protein
MSIPRILLVAALIAMLGFLMPRHVSAGSGNTTVTYRWLVSFNFNQNDDGVLRVWVREYSSATTYTERSSDTPILCEARGAQGVPIVDGAAHFENDGYLDCTLPSIRDAVQALHPGVHPTGIYDPFWIEVEGTLDTTVSSGVGGNPVFVHPSLAFFTPYDTTTATAQAQIATADYVRTSTPFAVLGNDTINAFQRNLWEENHNDVCRVAFRHNSVMQSHPFYPCPMSTTAMLFDLEAQPFTIGYSPIDKSYFKGAINRLAIDPVEWGVLD